MQKLVIKYDEIDIAVLNDTSTIEVPTSEVGSESNNTTEIQLLEEIRDIEKEQLSYIAFFVLIVLGGLVVYKLMKFLESFMW